MYVVTRALYRTYIAIGFWRPSGILAVKTPANQAMKARTPATMPITYRMM
jgi:hypothetical protein